jgi:hypothetical protein
MFIRFAQECAIDEDTVIKNATGAQFKKSE